MGVQQAGAMIAVAATAAVFVLREPRLRALATAVALMLTPVLLAGEVLGSGQLESLRAHAQLLIVAIVLAIALVIALSLAIRHRPALLPLLVVVAIPFRVPISLGDTTANLLVPLYLVVAAACVNFIAEQLRSRGTAEREPRPGWLEFALASFVSVYALQSLYSNDFAKALDQLVFFLIPFALLFKMLLRVSWTPRLVAGCGIAAVALALVFSGIGFWEYQTRHLFWNSRVIDANQFAAYFRVNSVFFDPNIFGRFLAVAMLIVVAAMLWRPTRGRYPLYLAVAAVLWGGLVITFSQSSLAALLVGLGVLAALRWNVRWTAVTAAGVAIVGSLLVIAFHDALHLRIDRFKSLDVATSGRLKLIGGGLDLFADRPLFGYGSGSFSAAYRERRKASSSTAATASHNIPVTVAAEQGAIGLMAYLALLIFASIALFARVRAPPGAGAAGFDVARAAIAAAFVAVVFHTMVYAAFLEDPVVWVLLAVGLALYRQRRL